MGRASPGRGAEPTQAPPLSKLEAYLHPAKKHGEYQKMARKPTGVSPAWVGMYHSHALYCAVWNWGPKKKKTKWKLKKKKKKLLENYFWLLELQKKQKYHFFVDFFLDFFLGSEQIFQIILKPFFSFFIFLHVKLRFLSVRVKLGEMRHMLIFIKSCDGCPESKKLRNKNIFGLEDFSGQKKSEYFAFFILQTKKHYNVPIGGLWPEIK